MKKYTYLVLGVAVLALCSCASMEHVQVGAGVNYGPNNNFEFLFGKRLKVDNSVDGKTVYRLTK